jgi:hypothetical protein
MTSHIEPNPKCWLGHLKEIVNTLNKEPMKENFQHIKEYQDNKVTYENFQLEGQLIVCADAEVSE